jgi:hypothetical protein
MFSFKMTSFRKSSLCPSSHELLAYLNGKSSEKDDQKVKRHISVCEFCAAELGFYARFPQPEENFSDETFSDIPRPLYELAEAILSKKYLDYSFLNKLLGENEGVKV